MKPEQDALFPPAPVSVATSGGEPRFGTYQGELPEVDLPRLQGQWAPGRTTRLLKRKRWQYTFAATPEVAALFAVVDLGYSSSAFAVALDLRERKPLCDVSFLGTPGPMVELGDKPGQGLKASFRTLGGRLSVQRGEDDERYRVAVDVSRLRTGSLQSFQWEGDLMVAGGPPALTVVSPVEGDGLVNVTMKSNGLLTFGSLEAGGKRFRLDGGVGGMDYTQGYLARHTAWRWAFASGRLADGTPVGINLVEGFNEGNADANENALWLGDKLYPLARARFEYDAKDLMAPWRLATVDGAVDLRFQPLHVHREDRNLRLVVSHFAQPVGFFNGTVRVGSRTLELSNVPGVTEDQDMLW
ncbi:MULTISPECIES: DUF2804 domain-containing protein [Myxococcus]|uniref:DUF2804 domain-containing protein n=1 Tax=Myxococcus TaxID=32 RepID=UPI001143A25D|nr:MULTISPECIES: DUF2804 domain-containing protein [Myxococcus]NOK01731.1 DUF2804 domain-containing protein [Myxococcus xanthus]